MKISLRRHHALMVEDGAFSHKKDYVTKGIQIALLVQKLWQFFFEWVDLPISRSEQTPGNGFHPVTKVLRSNEATTNGSNDKPCKI